MTSYERIGVGYRGPRGEDPRIAAAIRCALGDVESLVNVGAGTGSYEPADVRVVAVEPSAQMLRQRAPVAAAAVQGAAEAIPLADGAVDAALGVLTIHHWTDLARGCAELLRVTRRRVVLLTFDPEFAGWWLTRDYFPRFADQDRAALPPLPRVAALLGGARIEPVPVPHDCVDGFLGAYWKRPRAYLDPDLRRAISSFAAAPPERLADGLARLEADLAGDAWAAKHGAPLAERTELDLGYRLLIAER